MSKMAILGQKWLFLAIFRGLCGVTCPETLACERSTHYSHTIKKSALYIENSKNGGQKGFAIPCVDVPLMAPKNWVSKVWSKFGITYNFSIKRVGGW